MEIVSFQSGQVSPGIKYYTVDTEADKNNLPVGEMGNRCYVIESKKWYILNSNGEWVPFAAEGGAVDTDAILSAVENMTDAQRSQFISDLGFGTVFTFMGSVASRSDLPNSNNKVGYVYYVELDSSEYVWVVNQSHPNGYWEELGETFDVTVDSELSNTSENPVQNKVIKAALDGKGTYSKPSGGIPKSDLASAVQTSLGKADTALQSIPAGYATENWVTNKGYGTYSKPTSGIPKSDLTSAVQTSLGKADTALQSVPNTYRTAAAQDLIDEAQDARINQKADASALTGKVSVSQGATNAGKFLIVGSDGNVSPVAMAAWQGGSY